jgi:glycosyltransferase involved in cell wall biosynthesis
MIRVVQFADFVNRLDFIDVIVQHADPKRFEIGVCVGREDSNIAAPRYGQQTPRWLIPWRPRRGLATAAYRLARVLRAWRANVLHTHHYDEALIGWMATRLYRRCKLVVGRHYSDAIYRLPAGLKQRTLLGLEKIVNRGAARIVVPSRFIRELLTTRQRVPARKIDQVPYGFVPEKYDAVTPGAIARVRSELGLHDRLVIGNLSRLHEEKGQRYLLEAMAGLPTERPRPALVIVGEGPERGPLERQARALGLADSVRFLGWRRDALAVMGAVDLVVQPTLQEAFSQVMAEALWLGKALVMTDVSGAADVIRHRENGWLVPKADAQALREAIGALAADPALRQRLGTAGRSFVESNLRVEHVIPQYERCYERALGR